MIKNKRAKRAKPMEFLMGLIKNGEMLLVIGLIIVTVTLHKIDAKIANDDLDSPYEVSMRRIILESAEDEFEFIEISGLPWIEIDSPEDLENAKSVILPKMESFVD